MDHQVPLAVGTRAQKTALSFILLTGFVVRVQNPLVLKTPVEECVARNVYTPELLA